ncbi:hypothetical protein [Radiobacillus sp. PE A8.2]|uniref:hypothetical protein n=1 Tax=Radiobacillus sp. PE A8.2 TaxID=3380349 RepID=UPI0038901950
MNYLKVYNKENTEYYKGITSLLSSEDLLILEQESWFFPWIQEYFTPNRVVHKLLLRNSDYVIQGLISYSYQDNFLLINFLESAPINKTDHGLKISPALITIACIESFKLGFDGFVAMDVKLNTKLIKYYESLGAIYIGRNRMVLDTFHPIQ